ncbi:MAG: response regulator [Anaerolineae bacterium]|nr:response regulator [Anaerolineae bacterium]
MNAPIPRTILKDWVVLVVDDEADSLEVATRILRHYGAVVHTATNGLEGLDIVRTIKPRFIISDLSMPAMDGWGMLDALKRDRTTLEIPVIALTAHAMAGDREKAIMAGFHNYLTKPLTPATFLRDLLNLLTDIPEFASEIKVS